MCTASNIEIRTKRAIEREDSKRQEANGSEMSGYKSVGKITNKSE